MGSRNGAEGGGAGGGSAAGGIVLVGGGIALAFGAVAAVVWALQPAPEADAPAQGVPASPVPASPILAAPSPATPSPTAQTPAPVVVPESSAPVAAQPEATQAADLAFDTVRVTPEGEALVAGRANPGATVRLLVDGAEAGRALVDSQGSFVAMFTLPASDQPRLLSLVEVGPPDRVAEQTVALAPVTGPKLAEAAPAEVPTPAPQPAAETPQALLLTDEGAQVLQTAEAGSAGQVSVDAISYTPDGAVQLSGRAAPGATLRLYLDNAPLAEALPLGSGQWFTTLRDVSPGLYTLRADQIGPDGKVTSRFETPFLRETPEALAAALKPQAIPGQPRPLGAVTPPAPDAVADAASALAPSALLADATASQSEAPTVQEAQAVNAAESTPEAGTSDTTAAPLPSDAPLSITVQPGFTLWRIARDNFGDGVLYVKVFEANKAQIRDPDLIYPGQVFTIPKG